MTPVKTAPQCNTHISSNHRCRSVYNTVGVHGDGEGLTAKLEGSRKVGFFGTGSSPPHQLDGLGSTVALVAKP